MLELKRVLDESNINYSFYNISTKDTRAYKYTLFMLNRRYNFIETNDYIMLESVPQIPVIKLNNKDFSIVKFVDEVKKIKESMKNDEVKWLFF